MEKPDKYAGALFVLGLSALYNVSVRIISNIYDEPQKYDLGFTEPTEVITICLLLSAERYYASREIATTVTEEHTNLIAQQQDMDKNEVPEVADKEYAPPIDTNTI